MSLTEKTCAPCRGGVPPLTPGEAETYKIQVPEWELTEAATRIERGFKFGNFAEAMMFVNRVGELAEAEGHHPDITFGWGYAHVVLYTHKIKGLHENDFIMAAKIDRLA
jgi:4a-hydroxytetrahydrobiopterin dehydratase